MITHLDYITVVVRDVEKAKEFGPISGEKFEKYMNVSGIKAEHHTLVLTGSLPLQGPHLALTL